MLEKPNLKGNSVLEVLARSSYLSTHDDPWCEPAHYFILFPSVLAV